jgi:hypothetical protein
LEVVLIWVARNEASTLSLLRGPVI